VDQGIEHSAGASFAKNPLYFDPENIVKLALEGGCGGLVLAAEDLQTARELAPRLKRVVPGIRLAGGDRHDQARTATPQEAVANGADLLVVGSALFRQADYCQAMTRLRREMQT
jgi:orotidine-5'-phosphate decarboxylase